MGGRGEALDFPQLVFVGSGRSGLRLRLDVCVVSGGGGVGVGSNPMLAQPRNVMQRIRAAIVIQSAALRSAVVLKEVHSVDAPNRCTCINRFNDGTAEVQLTKGIE